LAMKRLLLLWVASILAVGQGEFEEPETLNSGISVRINQKAIDYVAPLAAEALHHLLENASVPTIEIAILTITGSIHEFRKPIILGHFVNDKGVRASVTIPRAHIEGRARVAIAFLNYNEHLKLTIDNATVTIEMHFSRDPKANLMKKEHCSINEPIISAQFDGRGINWFRSFIEKKIVEAVRDVVCQIALDAIVFLGEQNILPDGSIGPTPVPTVAGPDEVLDTVVDFALDLCTPENLEEGQTSTSTSTTTVDPLLPTTPWTPSPWSIDLTLRYLPKFTDEHVTFGLDGGITYDWNLPNVERPPPMSPSLLGKKMLGAIISDYVPNTFFAHIHEQRIGEVEFDVDTEDIPLALRTIAKMMCADCRVVGRCRLARQPTVEIYKEGGVHVVMAGSISIVLHNNKKNKTYDILDATAHMHLNMQPVVKNNRIFGDIKLTAVKVEIKKMGVASALAKPLEKFVGFVVQKVVWPALKKKLRFALHSRGVQLPVLCGVQLENLSVIYADRAIILQSDARYDVALFVKKFKRYVNMKLAAAKLGK
ncbi:hypothetical protein PFISCL1PPCAC_3702, partial [Pristionchus fissidentatus]